MSRKIGLSGIPNFFSEDIKLFEIGIMTETAESAGSRPLEKERNSRKWKPQPRPGNPISAKKTGSRQIYNTNIGKNKHRVVYHKRNDLSEASRLNIDQNIPSTSSKGLYDQCEEDDENTVSPSSDDNLIRGMAHALALVIQVAAHGPKSINHEKAFYGIQFLSTIKNNYGELPPNILGFMEYIDYYTRDDGTEKAQPMIQPIR